jgi:hypothetical protein
MVTAAHPMECLRINNYICPATFIRMITNIVLVSDAGPWSGPGPGAGPGDRSGVLLWSRGGPGLGYSQQSMDVFQTLPLLLRPVLSGSARAGPRPRAGCHQPEPESLACQWARLPHSGAGSESRSITTTVTASHRASDGSIKFRWRRQLSLSQVVTVNCHRKAAGRQAWLRAGPPCRDSSQLGPNRTV